MWLLLVDPNHYAAEGASVKLLQDCLVNTNTSPLMHIFQQYNIFMKILFDIKQ